MALKGSEIRIERRQDCHCCLEFARLPLAAVFGEDLGPAHVLLRDPV